MKKGKLLALSQGGEPARQRRNYLFVLAVRRRYEHMRTVLKESQTLQEDAYTEESQHSEEQKISEPIKQRDNQTRNKERENILKYYDDNKNVIKTTNYILREHLSRFIYINQRNSFYNYFYNAFPSVLNNYLRRVKRGREKEGDHANGAGTDNHNASMLSTSPRNTLPPSSNEESKRSLSILHYYNTHTMHEMENDNFIDLISQKVNCLSNAGELLRSIHDNVQWGSIRMNSTNLNKLEEIFENIMERTNDTNDINKKVEILLYLSNVCNENSFPKIHEGIKKRIQEIYEHIKKKNKKGVDELYILFLLYKQFLSSKNEKYSKMNVETYLSEEIPFYNYLKNENINMCLLSLIYRDLSFLKNDQVKYVLMNLAFSKMKDSFFFSKAGEIADSRNNGGSKNGSIPDPSRGNAHTNLVLTFFTNTLLRNNFLHFLQNDYISSAHSTVNYTTRINPTNVNNYIFYNLLISIVQLKESQAKCRDAIMKKKMQLFLCIEKNNTTVNELWEMRNYANHVNDFILNNVLFFTSHFVKHKINFSPNMYLYILNVYSDLFDMMKGLELYTGIKKKKNLLSDCKQIVNYVINEIYKQINLYTLKEFVALCAMIDKLPANFTFELKNDADHLRLKVRNSFYKNDQGGKDETVMENEADAHLRRILYVSHNQESKKITEVVAGAGITAAGRGPILEQKYGTTLNKQQIKEHCHEKDPQNSVDLSFAATLSNGAPQLSNLTEEPLTNRHVTTKTKKKSTIINKHDFTILIALSLFNEINDEFIVQIRQKEKIPPVNGFTKNSDDAIFEHIYKNHYESFVRNSDMYLNHVEQNYDSDTAEQMLNYFILFTQMSQLDVSDLCVLINTMKEINKLQPFIDFFIAKRVEEMLRERGIGRREESTSGLELENKGTNYQFTDSYLDDYICRISNRGKEHHEEHHEGAVASVQRDNECITQWEELPNIFHTSERKNHFDDMNLNTHSLYASGFEKYYHSYDICSSVVNLFLLVDSTSRTYRTISKFLPHVNLNQVDIFKIHLDHLFVKGRSEKAQETLAFSVTPQTGRKNWMGYSEQEESLIQNFTFAIDSDTISSSSNPFVEEAVNGGVEWGKSNLTHHGQTPLEHDIIYKIVEARLKYNIEVKNYLSKREDENSEEIKNFLENELLPLNKIANMLNSISSINDDEKYTNLVTIALKDIFLRKHEIVDIKTFRAIGRILTNIRNVYKNIFFPCEYSYLNMLTKNYVQVMQNFFHFFHPLDYFQALQIFTKYNLAKKYLKHLICLNDELNKVNIKNVNVHLVHLVLYFYRKLNYVNEKFISNILHKYAYTILQQMNTLNVHAVENLIKTNDFLLSLCIRNKDIIQLNYLILQRYGNFSRQFKIEEDKDDVDERGVITSLSEQDSVAQFAEGESQKVDTSSSKQFCLNEEGTSTHTNWRTGQTPFTRPSAHSKGEVLIQSASTLDFISHDQHNSIPNLHQSEDNGRLLRQGNQTSQGIYTHGTPPIGHSPHIPYTAEQKNAKDMTTNTLVTHTCHLSITHKIKIIYFLCKFHHYNDLVKSYYIQLISECLQNTSTVLNEEDYCKLYEIYVHVILNFYFLSFNKSNKYINFVLNNLPCYYWYKREEEKLNLFVSSKEYNDIQHILKLLNMDFLAPTLTEIYFIHFFNDVKKNNHALPIPENLLHLYKKYNLLIDDVQNKSVSILCVPEEHVLRDEHGNNKNLINDSHYVYENIKKTYPTSLIFLSEWKTLNVEEKCDYVLRAIHTSLNV
ncbi:conserved Plasmodium protein, unknown function [Plasmodium knowlesi strain H]|uniref:Uncharacterized protein n=3 Tax=Plasmodium knowlesi TaxID=5850 RepID=A0A5K1V799_PLAKH|nr:conserved Plasmodium protein, unknown function [Plasmodium knowlesi strain H]OTN66368.1 Uncharacterized protein PKNOH_S09545900 [Plasmodium knowlesi]CAA9989855.1 conserved Plasmodium protein, unknown function [Plasmodium knowlesi strain H]SBO24409.1 conserved Plasmodium protein, unknown function [Plasmodium knowlesi strain H]SBO26600.1 conserved Plasmodium protein, unknown function [Plasmodium knowlesi strain H]VVS79329.1 conserved Plasmodium protein, unknown function [Plasmodium knowlesi s|eukprot:XP_002259870.1 hypothetical protein, conserved in Plasmodium species [Plasmodium knowlesi strain H]